MTEQVRSYYGDFWEYFGITALTIWDLPYHDFVSMSLRADYIRREREKEANKHGG